MSAIAIYQPSSAQWRYNPCVMRLISIQPAPVARIFALSYAVCGLIAFAQYALTSVQSFILPVGILMGVFHLNMNFQLGRSPYPLSNAFLCIGAFCPMP